MTQPEDRGLDLETLEPGRVRELSVIGDKNARGATIRLQSWPDLLERLQRVGRDPVLFVHVVRNPYDNISTMAKRNDSTLGHAASTYFGLSETALSSKRRVGDDRVMSFSVNPSSQTPRAH
jgi:hypothetical protein